MGGRNDAFASPVWAQNHVALSTCPKSFITAESQSLVEDFFMRRQLGGLWAADLTAKQADAFVVLGRELQSERNDGKRSARETV